MSEKSGHLSNNSIEQLLEENIRLKKLLRDKNIDFEKLTDGNQFLAATGFEKSITVSKLAYWQYSFQNQKLDSTGEAYKILEISPDESLSSDKILDRIHPDNRKQFVAEMAKKIENEDTFNIDTRLLVSDGSIKYVSINVIVERDEAQNPITISGTITDNTENHFFIDELKGNEQLFRSLFNNLTDIFVIFEIIENHEDNTIDYIYRDVNPVYEMKMGVNKADIIDKKLSAKPGLFQQLNPLFQISKIAGQPQQDRLYIHSLDSFFDILIYSPSENYLATIWRDVTLMVEAESSLRESEEKYRQIFSIGSDALFMFDFFSGKILDVNPTGCKLFGYSRESLLKMLFKQLFAAPDKLLEEITDQKSLLHDFISLKSNGTEFPVEVSLSYFNWSGHKVSVASVRDISERILSQEKLIKSEQKFKQLFDYSNDAILLIKNYRIIDFNQKSISLFQLPPEELLNKTLWNLSPSSQASGEESRLKAVDYIQNSLLGNQLQFEWVFNQSNKKTFIADIKLSPIIVGNEKVVQAIVRDISPQKETQKALMMKEKLWKASLQISSIGVWEWNLITRDVYFSAVWKNIIGYEKDELTNKIDELYSRVHADDILQLKKSFDDYFSLKTQELSTDFRMRCKNGTYKWIRSQGKIFTYNNLGKPEHFIGTHIDITKQKIQEEKINQELHNFSFSNSISQLGYWSLDLRTMVVTGSKSTFAILGFNDTDQLSLRQIEKIIHPEDQQNFISQYVAQTSVASHENIFRIISNNTTSYILSRSRPVKNSKNVLTGFRGTFQNITFLKQESSAAKNEKIFLTGVVNNLQHAIQITKDNVVVFSNSKVSELTGYSHNDINSKNISPLLYTVQEDSITLKKCIDSILLNPQLLSEKIEIRIETKNNRIKWVEMSISSVEIKDEKMILFVFSDISDKKKTSLELLSSEKLFKSIVSNTISAIALYTTSGQYAYSNDSFNALSGLNTADLKNKSFESLFNEPDYIVISKGVEALSLSKLKLYTTDIRQIGVTKAWVRITITASRNEANIIDYFILNCENIDFEKKRILKYETDNASLKVLKESSPFGFAIFNSRFELTNFNEKFTEDLNLQNKSKTKILFADVEKIIKQHNTANRVYLDINVPHSLEIPISSEKIILVDIIPADINDEKSLLVYTSNTTKSRIKIDSLTLQLKRFQGLFENAPLGVILVDKNRNIIISNKKFEKNFSYNTDELNFIKLDNLIDTQHLGEYISKFSQLFTGINNSFQQFLKMNSKNGDNRWINANVSSLKDDYGDSKYAIFIIEDITDLKNEEQTLLSKERLQTLSYIANSFAHEFNNLLMGIYGNAYLLDTSLKETSLTNYTNNLLRSTNRASELTHKLLSFSGKSNTLNIIINSDELINESIDALTIGENIKVTKIINNKNETLIGDPFQLKRAIQYILGNALEAMSSKDGELTIETNVVYFEPDEKIDNQSIEKGKYLRIIISDTGAGISASDLINIFDPFYSTKPSGLNTGLGLVIAKQVISSHNGVIKVYSTKDKGTSFNIYLPVKEINKAIVSVQPDEKLLVKGSAKILLIDDEEIVRLITSELLNQLGYDVYSFASGKKAIKFYKDNFHTIDLVLLDKHMPDMDGVEVLQNLNKINQSVKVLILTGYNIDKEMEDMLSQNLCGFVQKPVSIEKLSRSISEVLFN